MFEKKIPIIVLGGSDRKSTKLPASGRDKHPLSGCKGMDIRIGNRSMIEAVTERLEASGAFAPIYIAGPASVYGRINAPAELIDTDRSFGENIRISLEAVRAAHPGSAVSFITCDVLPEVPTLREMMEQYNKSTPCDLWFPLIRAPRSPGALGAFAWKPVYRIAPREGAVPFRILPGHWVVIDPDALRLKFLYRLFNVGYETRNRRIDKRRSVMVRKLLSDLLYQDLLHLFGFRLPTLTWTVLSAGIPAATALREGTITRQGLEEAMRRIFVRRRHRKQYPERQIHTPLVDGLSLALDVDTEEEAREIGGETETGPNDAG
jgi:hypothetical protein